MNEITITQHGDQLTVSSVQVAADFGKRHADVLESIEKNENGKFRSHEYVH